jgi:Ca2+-binding EF-hand superfamily protein
MSKVSKEQLLKAFSPFDKAKNGLIPSEAFRNIFALGDLSKVKSVAGKPLNSKFYVDNDIDPNLEEMIKESKLEINGTIDYLKFIDIILSK